MFDTIVALATPPLISALAVIRVSGAQAFMVVSQCFSKPIIDIKERTIVYGYMLEDEHRIDEVLLNVYKGPRSYTGEDLVEIQCHGSPLIARRIISVLLAHGARMAERGEFTARAFYHNRLDLVQAEAVNDLIHAPSEEAAQQSLLSLQGQTSALISPLRTALADLLANMEANIDYPEYEDLEVITAKQVMKTTTDLLAQIARFLKEGEEGLKVREGVKIAIVGKPNVGKSSLLNALLKEDKAIVTDIAGTTRDIVEGDRTLAGIPLHFLDTAGIRSSDDPVEAIGIARAEKAMKEADLVLLVLDGSKQEEEEDQRLLALSEGKKRIILYNKKDLYQPQTNQKGIHLSAQSGDVSELEREILRVLEVNPEAFNRPSFANVRQLGLLKRIEQHLKQAQSDAQNGLTLDLIAVSIQSAYRDLLEILGEAKGNDFSEEIFSRFCLGK